MKQRIWELDAFRGLCVLGMLFVHFIYDAVELFGVIHWNYPPSFFLLKQWGGIFFLLLSGICVTLGTRHIRRGLIVFLCGLLCTAVTAVYAWVCQLDSGFVIWFGVLHCLGLCMLLWQLFQKFRWWLLTILGIAMVVLGIYLNLYVTVSHPFFIFLGIPQHGFASGDYFPILPNFGLFLLGAALGKTVYKHKRSLLPKVSDRLLPIRFLIVCGRQSLPIYLLHQPVFMAILFLISAGGNL